MDRPARLTDAVAADAAEAFARFAAERGDEPIVALALCTVEDAAPPYIKGAVVGDIGPIRGSDLKSWRNHPADWSWSDGPDGRRPGRRCSAVICEILDAADQAADPAADDPNEIFAKFRQEILQGMADGLQRFGGIDIPHGNKQRQALGPVRRFFDSETPACDPTLIVCCSPEVCHSTGSVG